MPLTTPFKDAVVPTASFTPQGNKGADPKNPEVNRPQALMGVTVPAVDFSGTKLPSNSLHLDKR